MTEAELEAAIAFIVRDLLDDDTLRLDTTMSAADLPGYDSFTQVEYVAALEDRFAIHIPLATVEQWQTLGDSIATVASLIATRPA